MHFSADNSPRAYEQVVERLFESPRFGEHMARFWLDAARYGDTHGLHLDNYREIWPYRDWVDPGIQRERHRSTGLSPTNSPATCCRIPRSDQTVATGFVRCNVSTSEGGSIDEECYVRNVVDRVDTFGTVMLGLTAGCCALPRPQVRSDHAAGLLQPVRLLQQPRGDGRSMAMPPSTPPVVEGRQRRAARRPGKRVKAQPRSVRRNRCGGGRGQIGTRPAPMRKSTPAKRVGFRLDRGRVAGQCEAVGRSVGVGRRARITRF